jgi:hypothetical protein
VKSPSDYLPTSEEQAQPTPKPAPIAKPLGLLERPVNGDPGELLKYRFLCRGGGLLLVGPTGIGKSSLGMQAAILWAIGREMFGIKPVKPLKSLIIQAENDEGDLAEMRDGVIAGLNLSEDDRRLAFENVIVAREDERTGPVFFAEVVRPLLEEHRPDLLWIDPVLAYLGGEVGSQRDVGGFLRNMLNPLLREFQCAVVVVHHTNKPAVGKEKPDWSAGDFAYVGGGSAEWANWARAVLALRSLGLQSVFELRAGKRGSRLGWREPDGETVAYAKLIAHANQPNVICWREADPEEVPEQSKSKRIPEKADVLIHVPGDKAIAKETLRSKANRAGIALNKINPFIDELIADGVLYEWKKKRTGTNALKLIARFPQPEEELIS